MKKGIYYIWTNDIPLKLVMVIALFCTPLSMWGQKKGIITTADTLIMRANLQDSTVAPIKLNGDFVRFEKTSPQSFQINDMPLDTTTTDSLCYRKQRVTLQYDMYFYTQKEYTKYNKTKATDEPDIKAIDIEIRRLQEIKKIKIKEKGKQ